MYLNHTMDSDKSATLNLKFFLAAKKVLSIHMKKKIYTSSLNALPLFASSFVTSISEFDQNTISM